jgi:hypothetical protein
MKHLALGMVLGQVELGYWHAVPDPKLGLNSNDVDPTLTCTSLTYIQVVPREKRFSKNNVCPHNT